MIGAATGLLGVIGWPIGHSHSPAMHNAALRQLDLDYRYLAFAVAPSLLGAAIAGAAALGVRGLNVTIPHKEAALALCAPDALAASIGAVNTLLFEGGRVLGTNTDLAGLRALVDELHTPTAGEVVILGAGGAARAVVALFEERGQPVTLVSRSARALVVGGRTYRSRPWEAAGLHALLERAAVLVDATPRGLTAELETLDLSPLPASARVIDLVVRRQTALTAAARARGLAAAAGATMLLHQGAASFERWTGRKPPLSIMRAALEASLASAELVT